jgi:hypothetical protein
MEFQHDKFLDGFYSEAMVTFWKFKSQENPSSLRALSKREFQRVEFVVSLCSEAMAKIGQFIFRDIANIG